MKKNENIVVPNESNAWETLDKPARKEAISFAEKYKTFISTCKTEREVVNYLLSEIEKEGFKPLENISNAVAGTKFYASTRGKILAIGVIRVLNNYAKEKKIMKKDKVQELIGM